MKPALILSVILLFPMCGCDSGPKVVPVDKTRSRLQAISAAYIAATMKANRAPSKPDELLPFLGDESTSEEEKRATFRSDNDGEEFVIVWGVDLRKMGTGGLSRDVIIVYEKRGKSGQRYVLKPRADIFIIPDEVFQKSQFPNGHRPSS